jgi:DEAD/DEAH box helicase domain-containing protein
LTRISSSDLLRSLGYDFEAYSEDGIRPKTVEVSFGDLFPELYIGEGKSREIADKKLYLHQMEALNSLEDGKNIILISGTGSGKTEGWFFYTAKGKRTLALYPTLALANDQIRRLENYSRALGMNPQILDARRRELLVSSHGAHGIREVVASSNLVITNPAFLLVDLKRLSKGYLLSFLRKLELLVLDELDFYGPREIALLLSIIRIISLISERKPQIAVLTATLGNPDDLASFLTSTNGRETSIIRGDPFRPRNDVYLVLGKNLRSIWDCLKAHEIEILSSDVGEDVRNSLKDYKSFEREVYKLVEIARSLGIECPQPFMDPAEIISNYERDEGVTVVFTNSIRSAENLRKRLVNEFGLTKVASHHHLVPKDERERIEDAARSGELRILISPRTLSQGIDIGNIIRIVHLGLPDSLREFKQREGRKGRKDVGWTETVIFPLYRWDRELLSRGADAMAKWLKLPLEITLVNPSNKYSMLFEGLFKVINPQMRDHLREEEIRLLTELGLISQGNLTERGKRVWEMINFYEFGPPYGFKRILKEDSEFRYLEDIGHCDLVERFQPGCIDYGNDSIVLDFRRKGRVITGVIEGPFNYGTIYSFDALAFMLEEYERIKAEWGERPDIIDDYHKGRIGSEVVCVVDPPIDGFGLRTKVPNRVYWKLSSSKVRPVNAGKSTILLRENRSLPVITQTGGVYRDYTYGISVELDPKEDLVWLRIGLATLMLVLRLSLGIHVDSIYYEVANLGEKKVMMLHEPESAGLIEKLDWLKVAKEIDLFEPDDLSEIIMMLIDEEAHYEFVIRGLNWNLAKRFARRAVDYILAKQMIPFILEGKSFMIPRPSRANKVLSLDFIGVRLSDSISIGFLGLYDGENTETQLVVKEFFDSTGMNLSPIEKCVNEGFIVVGWDFDSLLKDLFSMNQRTLCYILQGLREEGRFFELKPLVEDFLNLSPVSLEEVARRIWGIGGSMKDVIMEARRSIGEIEERKGANWERYTKYLREKAKNIIEERARAIYLTFLALGSEVSRPVSHHL